MYDHNVYEHEMAHFLARFEDTTVNGTYYDVGEHAPPGTNNILRPGGTQGVPLVIPGKADDVNTEQGKIWKRIFDGDWLNP